jgi:hypothetical protein
MDMFAIRNMVATIVVLIILSIILPPVTVYGSVRLRNILRITRYDENELMDEYKKTLKNSYSLIPAILIACVLLVLIGWYISIND